MRWLRCLLSREFKIDMSLLFWDFIFGGVETQQKISMNSKVD